jgi:hypothetical protein
MQVDLALGLVGKFWRPVIAYAKVTAEAFRDFSDPGYAKTALSRYVRWTGLEPCYLG